MTPQCVGILWCWVFVSDRTRRLVSDYSPQKHRRPTFFQASVKVCFLFDENFHSFLELFLRLSCEPHLIASALVGDQFNDPLLSLLGRGLAPLDNHDATVPIDLELETFVTLYMSKIDLLNSQFLEFHQCSSLGVGL